jgi:tetratricopeptide (TPR) repeat protein
MHAQQPVLERLQQIHRMVMDPAQRFSISATLGELGTLEARIANGGPDSTARGELNFLRGFILYRAKRPRESLGPYQEAGRIDAVNPFLTVAERMRLHYNIATQAEGLREWAIAISHFEQAIPLIDADPSVTRDARLGTRERLAYCLQEAGRHADAKKLNLEVLTGAEGLFGADSEKLLTVLNNLAQNTYELKEFAAARGYLERRLTIATKHAIADKIGDGLFQLGVLSFEQGNLKEAESFMQRRLAIAKASGDRERIRRAQEDLDELYAKMRK